MALQSPDTPEKAYWTGPQLDRDETNTASLTPAPSIALGIAEVAQGQSTEAHNGPEPGPGVVISVTADSEAPGI